MSESDKYEDHRPKVRGVAVRGVTLTLHGTFLTCLRLCGVNKEQAIARGPSVTLQGDDLSSFHFFRYEDWMTLFGDDLPINHFFDEEGNPLPEGTKVTLRGTDLRRLCLFDKNKPLSEFLSKLETIEVTLRVVKHNP